MFWRTEVHALVFNAGGSLKPVAKTQNSYTALYRQATAGIWPQLPASPFFPTETQGVSTSIRDTRSNASIDRTESLDQMLH